ASIVLSSLAWPSCLTLVRDKSGPSRLPFFSDSSGRSSRSHIDEVLHQLIMRDSLVSPRDRRLCSLRGRDEKTTRALALTGALGLDTHQFAPGQVTERGGEQAGEKLAGELIAAPQRRGDW